MSSKNKTIPYFTTCSVCRHDSLVVAFKIVISLSVCMSVHPSVKLLYNEKNNFLICLLLSIPKKFVLCLTLYKMYVGCMYFFFYGFQKETTRQANISLENVNIVAV